MSIWFYIIYAVICLGVFIYFLMERPSISLHLTNTEYVIVTLLLSVVSPAALVIVAVGYPFYLLHRLFGREKSNSDNSTEDDDEPQGFDYEEHEDWTDGTKEYEND